MHAPTVACSIRVVADGRHRTQPPASRAEMGGCTERRSQTDARCILLNCAPTVEARPHPGGFDELSSQTLEFSCGRQIDADRYPVNSLQRANRLLASRGARYR